MGKESLDKKQAKRSESKEAEKLPPVTFIYRENDLFKSQIPEIISHFNAINRDVKIHEFPRTTKKEEIRKWFTNNWRELMGATILTDNTVQEEILKTKIKLFKGMSEAMTLSLGAIENVTIDKILADSAISIIKGDDKLRQELRKTHNSNNEKSRDLTGKVFASLIKEMIKTHNPEKVSVFLAGTLDHTPFLELGWKYEKNKDKAYEIVKEQINRWLIEGGIDQDNIIFNAEQDPQKIKDSVEKIESTLKDWIICDRHFEGYSGGATLPTDSIRLQLPLETFVEDAAVNGLIRIDPSERKKALKQTLKEQITKERLSGGGSEQSKFMYNLYCRFKRQHEGAEG